MSVRIALVAVAASGLWLAACGGAETTEAPGETAPPEIEQPTDRVVSEIVGQSQFDQPVIVFALDGPLQPGDVIGPYQAAEYEPVPEQRAIEEPTWFFWIDLAPGAHFAHPNKFVYVSAVSGAITSSEEMWWPVLNGEGLWIEEEDYWNSDNWAFHNVDLRPQQHVDASASKLLARPARQPLVDNGGQKAAIVINGWREGEEGGGDFALDAENAVDTFGADGFTTTYFGPENANITAATHGGAPGAEQLAGWFNARGRELGAGDSLVVYIGGHGWATESGSGFAGGVSERSLQTYLGNIDLAVDVTVIIQSCHSGAFVDGISDLADITITSTDSLSLSYGDIDPHLVDAFLPFVDMEDVNPEDLGSEFTSGLLEDWNQARADAGMQVLVQERAETTGTGHTSNLAGISFVSAVEKDAAAEKMWEFPLAVWGSTRTRVNTMVDGTDDGVDCVTGEPLAAGQTSPEVDIGSANVYWNEDGSALNADIVFPRVGQIGKSSVFGGMEFDDPTARTSPPNPNWFFDGIGDHNFVFAHQPPSLSTFVHSFDGRQWGQDDVDGFLAELAADAVQLTIPREQVPQGRFYVSATNGTVCDSVGLDPKRAPVGVVPPITLPPITVGGAAARNDSFFQVFDPVGDTTVCSSGVTLSDDAVDLIEATINGQPDDPFAALEISALLSNPAGGRGEEFSFAVTLDLRSQDQPVAAFISQVHDNVRLDGEIDPIARTPVTSDVVVELPVVEIDEGERSQFRLTIPSDRLPTLAEIDQLFFQSFHMASAQSECTRDELVIFLTPRILQDYEGD